MTSSGVYSNNNKNTFDRKNYSNLVAQASKNAVRKKILEIRRGGARAADEILDQLLLGDNKKTNKGKNNQNSEITAHFYDVLSKHRAKWRNFIVEAAARFDPDALACFGTNLIYGGLMTSSYGGAAFASLLKLEEARRSLSVHETFSEKESSTDIGRSREISGLLSRGRMQGNMVWVIIGREAFSPQMLKNYRYEPEIAFILMGNNEKSSIIDAFPELSRLKNVLTVLDERDTELISKWSKTGMLYAVSDSASCNRAGNWENFLGTLDLNNIPSGLKDLIKDPSFPIRADGILPFFNAVESILSGGARKCIPEYKV